jgi:hypothetical protein
VVAFQRKNEWAPTIGPRSNAPVVRPLGDMKGFQLRASLVRNLVCQEHHHMKTEIWTRKQMLRPVAHCREGC